MLISQILWMFRQFLIFAVLGVAGLAVIFSIIYFVIYKKVMKGQKRINFKQTIKIGLFMCYILMVLYATLFSRESMGYCSVNLDLFSSYREAWNSFTLRGWQLLILNIVMFVPFGMLLPLIHKKFKSMIWTASASALFTLVIETVQLVFNLGVFEADDLMNNFAGAMIGYGLTMVVLTVLHKEGAWPRKVICYLLPLLLVACVYAGIFIKYHTNELGNLAEAYSQEIRCENAQIHSDITLSKESKKGVIYKTKVYDKKTGAEYAEQIFKTMGIPVKKLGIVQYNDNAIYSTLYHDKEHTLWMDYAGGLYDYTDYSFGDFKTASGMAQEEAVLSALKKMNVVVPEGLNFVSEEQDGQFCFKADMIKYQNKYLLGDLRGTIYEDGVIRNLSNYLATLEKYKDVDMMSESEAFDEIKQGKFKLYLEDELSSLTVQAVKLEYRPDSKGFYQPVYSFKVRINGKEDFIDIPALI
ncbi:VanZ family protein [Aminipila terrae]|uniref:VanZ-like domain-containing protein n=1 Tax=Aminipila terrae TaxID=2697030 RepID=A0A6P1MGR4_9FIRM|nr:VanZ family protein [Aminipila terrae]QHI71208.1 hypothetical protein Ami3637_01290 [Aminipila terrae]